MLKRRLIPKLQLKWRPASDRLVLVTTVGFGHVHEIGDPVSQARIYEAQATDELIFLDLDGGRGDRDRLVATVRATAEEVFMPFTVGGGIRSVDDFRLLLANGADKISVNTGAVEDPTLVRRAADAFGSQCVVVSIDYRRGPDGAAVWVGGGRVATDLEPVAWAVEAQRLGAGELLLTSIDRDGGRQGLDVELTRRVVDAVDIPVITSGGCGTAAHFVEGFVAGGADAVSSGTYFSFRDENPMQTRSQIRNAGVPIRLHT